jgi:hypothetical protein
MKWISLNINYMNPTSKITVDPETAFRIERPDACKM